jgi:hypothetical protein
LANLADHFWTVFVVFPKTFWSRKFKSRNRSQDEQVSSVQLQKILTHLDEMAATKPTRPSDPRIGAADTTLVQVLSAVTDLKNQFLLHEQVSIFKNLTRQGFWTNFYHRILDTFFA